MVQCIARWVARFALTKSKSKMGWKHDYNGFRTSYADPLAIGQAWWLLDGPGRSPFGYVASICLSITNHFSPITNHPFDALNACLFRACREAQGGPFTFHQPPPPLTSHGRASGQRSGSVKASHRIFSGFMIKKWQIGDHNRGVASLHPEAARGGILRQTQGTVLFRTPTVDLA